MKRIEAIIKEEHLDGVKTALDANGIVGLTISHCRGRGKSGGISLEGRAGTYRVDLLHKVMIMLVVRDEDVTKVTDSIMTVCQTDPTGGAGKIFISPIDDVIRIRTGERGEAAI